MVCYGRWVGAYAPQSAIPAYFHITGDRSHRTVSPSPLFGELKIKLRRFLFPWSKQASVKKSFPRVFKLPLDPPEAYCRYIGVLYFLPESLRICLLTVGFLMSGGMFFYRAVSCVVCSMRLCLGGEGSTL